MKTLVSVLALSLIVAFSAPAFAGTPKTQAACEKGRHALGRGCQEMLQGYVDSTPRGLKGQRRFHSGAAVVFVRAGRAERAGLRPGGDRHMKEGMPEFPTQRRSEGRGWQNPINRRWCRTPTLRTPLARMFYPRPKGKPLAKEKEGRPKPTPPIAPTL